MSMGADHDDADLWTDDAAEPGEGELAWDFELRWTEDDEWHPAGMTSQSENPESERPVEQQGLPTSPVDDDQPGRSFRGDEPDAGSEGSMGTKADDADAENADAAREADEATRSAERGHESRAGDN